MENVIDENITIHRYIRKILKRSDLRESHRKQLSEMRAIIKQLEKQKTELLNGFKKQMLLIDNIKRQKGHLEVLRTIELAENEFVKILDWKPPMN